MKSVLTICLSQSTDTGETEIITGTATSRRERKSITSWKVTGSTGATCKDCYSSKSCTNVLFVVECCAPNGK